MTRERSRLLEEVMTRQQSEPISSRKSLVDNQGRPQQTAFDQLREDPVSERENVVESRYQG